MTAGSIAALEGTEKKLRIISKPDYKVGYWFSGQKEDQKPEDRWEVHTFWFEDYGWTKSQAAKDKIFSIEEHRAGFSGWYRDKIDVVKSRAEAVSIALMEAAIDGGKALEWLGEADVDNVKLNFMLGVMSSQTVEKSVRELSCEEGASNG